MMNRYFRTFSRPLVTASLLLLATLAAASDADPELDAARARISTMIDFIGPENVSGSPVKGWYTIQKGAFFAYATGDGRYVIQGDLFDLEAKVNLSELSRTEMRRSLVNSLEDKDVILFSPTDPKYSVTVFTDVDCTYCRKLHAEIGDYMSRGIAVRYVLYPRNGPASRAWGTSEDVLCASDRGVALTAAKLGQDFESAKCDSSLLSRHYILGQDIGLNGTPAIILEDGTFIGGYVTPAMLSMRLAAATKR